MNIEWNWKTIMVFAVILILFIGTNAGQYYLLWTPKQEKMKAAYELQIAGLQAQIQAFGPMVDIWAVKEEAAGLFAGKQIDENDLTMRQIPESLITPSFVLDPEKLIGKYYRIGVTGGTPLSWDMVMEDPVDDTTREYDVVANVKPIGLKVGDYVDYRIVYPMGEDYIILPHKRIEAMHEETIKFILNEPEIHFYQAALIDYFLQRDKGSILYMTKYLEPGIQKPAKEYYAIPKNIQAIILADPNIAMKINGKLNDKTRTIIDTGIGNVSDEAGGKIAGGRGEISGKINGGFKQQQEDEKAIKEALLKAQADAAAGLPAPQPPQSAPASAPPSAPNSSPAPSLDAGDGVVE